MSNEVSKEQAVSVLIQAAKIGQAKGAFSLEDASLIAQAIKTLVPQPEAVAEVVTDEMPATPEAESAE